MTVIDIHTHVFPDEVAAAALTKLAASAGGHATHYDGTLAGLVACMDRCSVDVSVTQPVATRPGQVGSINDWAASQAGAFPGRIVPFGAMHPDFEDPATEIARMAGLGLRGFKLHPEYQSFAPHEPRMDAIYAAAVEQRMIVLFHAGADIGLPTNQGTPDSFVAVMDAWPDLTVVLAHLGGWREWEGVAAHIAGRDVWLDTSYTLGHLPDDEFVALCRAHGTHRVLFGTDGPWTDPVAEMEHLGRLGFTDGELAGILGGNAATLLGL